MKKCLILFICTFSIQIKAQNSFQWADSGAVWHLAYTAFVGPGYQKMMYEKDTIINNQPCQKMHREAQIRVNNGGGIYTLSPVYDEPPYFLYKSNDTVYSYFQNSFRMAFKTNANVGEIWDLGNYTGITTNIHAYVKVDSVYFQTYNGLSLRNIKIHHCDANGDSININSTTDSIVYSGILGHMSSGIINEKFGPLLGFNGIHHTSLNFIADEYMPSTLSCYQSATFPFIQFNTNDCYNNIFVGMENLGVDDFQLYPNPAHHQITINNKTGELMIISDIMGKIVLQKQLNSVTETIDIATLANGMYIIHVGNSATKLIKN
jgi:hypothetical protein